MKIPLFRSMAFFSGRNDRPIPHYSFAPIEAVDPRELIGSGPFPWLVANLPEGCRLMRDRETGDTLLFLAGENQGLLADQFAERFAILDVDRPLGDSRSPFQVYA
ncbi:MAG: hypothetical protein ABI353_13230 [Isosphaeraceae bacterium]